MVARIWSIVAIFTGVTLAQETGVENSTTPTSTSNGITIHTVSVGKATNQFIPNSIRAAPGDIVTFQFFPTNHSVIKSKFGYPCVPYEDVVVGGRGFFSGFHPVETIMKNPPSWNLTINSTEPTFYYCGAPGSCIDYGMVGVINANASTPIDTQIALAHKADYMLEPGQAFPNEAAASASSLAATATTATLTIVETSAPTTNSAPSASTSHHHGSSGLSTGAIAGIAVAAVLIAIIAAALFFLLGRTRSLKQALNREKDQGEEPSPGQKGVGSMSPAAFDAWRTPSQYWNQLPPYRNADRKPHEAGGVEVTASSPPLASPPLSEAGFSQHGSTLYNYDPHNPYFFSPTSELRGDRPAQNEPVELFSPPNESS